jgi:sugar transferase (PEP-CTERM/EpsH1 system associated)
MRILFVVPYTPNLIRVRPYNLIRSLASRGHQLTVFTLCNDAEDAADADALSDFCHQVICLPLPRWRSWWNCLAAVPHGVPLQSAYCWQPEMAEQLRQSINGYGEHGYFDVAHVEHLRGARYGLLINELSHLTEQRLPIVWDSVDSISSLFRQASAQSRSVFGRWITRFELGRTESYEGWLLSQFKHVLVTSPVDRQALLALAAPEKSMAQVNVLPNGVDLDYFFPNPEVTRDPETLVVTGKMSYHANVTMVLDLVQSVMPLIWEKQPAVKLFIVGKDPPANIQNLNQHPSITVTGTVPDIRPYLWRSTIALAPITYGVGIQNKILEAMACATPVVTSSQAIEALTAVSGQDLLVADGAEQYADQVVRLIANHERQRSLGISGHAYVQAHHNWETIATRLEEIYASTIVPN